MTTHDVFVAAAYLCAAIGVGGLVVWVMADHHQRRRELAQLEARGVRRRSDRAT